MPKPRSAYNMCQMAMLWQPASPVCAAQLHRGRQPCRGRPLLILLPLLLQAAIVVCRQGILGCHTSAEVLSLAGQPCRSTSRVSRQMGGSAWQHGCAVGQDGLADKCGGDILLALWYWYDHGAGAGLWQKLPEGFSRPDFACMDKALYNSYCAGISPLSWIAQDSARGTGHRCPQCYTGGDRNRALQWGYSNIGLSQNWVLSAPQ